MKKSQLLPLFVFFLALFLRIFKINQFPPGLYSDEASLGYSAYAIYKTLHDEYGNFLPVTLRSFGDYKPPGSVYLMIPFIALFGLNEVSVRLPSVILGSLTVVLVYSLSLLLFEQSRELLDSSRVKHGTRSKTKVSKSLLLPILASLFLCISPWHLHQSRSAMLVGVECFFITLAIFLFLKGLKKGFWLIGSSTAFVLAVYSYYGSRVTVPLLLLLLGITFRKELINQKKWGIYAVCLGLILLFPLVIGFAKNKETIVGRARFVSIFYDKNVWGQLWEARTLDGANANVYLTPFLHNKPFYYGKDILRRYLQHFSLKFLFLKGEMQIPFKIPNMGIVYFLDLPFFLAGLFYLLRKKPKFWRVLLIWLMVSPVTSSLTFITPASNRSFNMVIPWCIITAFGIAIFLKKFERRKIFAFFLCIFYFLFFIFYIYNYYHNIPWQIPDHWHYGKKELVEKISLWEKNFEKVYLGEVGNPHYIFLLFYKKYEPEKFRETLKINQVIDELGWEHVDGFDKYIFFREVEWKNVEKKERILYVCGSEEIPDEWQEEVNDIQYKTQVLDKIFYPNGKVAFKLLKLEKV